jgi:hypothetical protein
MDNMISKQPQLFSVIGDLIAKNMDWDGADEIEKRLKAMLPPQIAEMENMEGLPEEARPIVMNMQGQIQKMGQSMEQMKMALQEKDQIIQYQGQQLNDKGEKNQIDREKIHSQEAIALMKEDTSKQLQGWKQQHEKQMALLQDQLNQFEQTRAEFATMMSEYRNPEMYQ